LFTRRQGERNAGGALDGGRGVDCSAAGD
jgi:hypothetical protein